MKNFFKIKNIILLLLSLFLIMFIKYGWKYYGYEISAYFDFNRKELQITTPYGNGGACHPKVVCFKEGFNGYKYWMAYTPYPKHNSKFENPCILASNDLEQWEVPKELLEPCLDDLSYNKDKRIYNSDTHLLFNSDTKKLECWWRFVNDKDKEVVIYRRTSVDGIHWDAKEVVRKINNRKLLDYLSLSIVYEEGIYKIWYMFKGNIWLTATVNLKTFTVPQKMNINYGKELIPWHLDVEKTPKGYEMIYVAYPRKQKNHYNMKLYHCLSKDGIDWSNPSIVLEPRKYKSWDNGGLYRSSLLKIDDVYHVIYTGWGKNEGVGLGHVSGKHINSLR